MADLPAVVKRLAGKQDTQKAYCCMMEVPTPWPQALCQCRDWITDNLGRHVEGYHLELQNGEVVGHLYYALSEQALFPYEVESGFAVLYCDWIQTRYQGKGFGRRLFDSFLSDMRGGGIKGVLVEGTDIEGQMHFEQYQKRGFKQVYTRGHSVLLYLPISEDEVEIMPVKGHIHHRKGVPVVIQILNGYMCPYDVSTQIILRQVAGEYGDQVIVKDTWLTAETLQEFGVAKGIFINGRQKLSGAETEEAIRQAILEEINRA